VCRLIWPASWHARGRARTQLRIVGAPDDLFVGQAIPQGSWVMADEAGRAI